MGNLLSLLGMAIPNPMCHPVCWQKFIRLAHICLPYSSENASEEQWKEWMMTGNHKIHFDLIDATMHSAIQTAEKEANECQAALLLKRESVIIPRLDELKRLPPDDPDVKLRIRTLVDETMEEYRAPIRKLQWEEERAKRKAELSRSHFSMIRDTVIATGKLYGLSFDDGKWPALAEWGPPDRQTVMLLTRYVEEAECVQHDQASQPTGFVNAIVLHTMEFACGHFTSNGALDTLANTDAKSGLNGAASDAAITKCVSHVIDDKSQSNSDATADLKQKVGTATTPVSTVCTPVASTHVSTQSDSTKLLYYSVFSAFARDYHALVKAAYFNQQNARHSVPMSTVVPDSQSMQPQIVHRPQIVQTPL